MNIVNIRDVPKLGMSPEKVHQLVEGGRRARGLPRYSVQAHCADLSLSFRYILMAAAIHPQERGPQRNTFGIGCYDRFALVGDGHGEQVRVAPAGDLGESFAHAATQGIPPFIGVLLVAVAPDAFESQPGASFGERFALDVENDAADRSGAGIDCDEEWGAFV